MLTRGSLRASGHPDQTLRSKRPRRLRPSARPFSNGASWEATEDGRATTARRKRVQPSRARAVPRAARGSRGRLGHDAIQRRMLGESDREGEKRDEPQIPSRRGMRGADPDDPRFRWFLAMAAHGEPPFAPSARQASGHDRDDGNGLPLKGPRAARRAPHPVRPRRMRKCCRSGASAFGPGAGGKSSIGACARSSA